jgi:O-methyltransferase
MRKPADLYLELLKRTLTRVVDEYEHRPVKRWGRVQRALASRGVQLTRREPIDLRARELGLDWPEQGESMIGLRRLDQLHGALRDIIDRDVPGDLVETGVWRGGATIFMRAALEAYGDTSRTVWACDSFEGLPRPTLPQDEGDLHWTYPELAVSVEQVQQNFSRYGLRDDRVRFLKGWFSDTLPDAPIKQIAILRLDGDMYESTMDALKPLYPKLSVGGYCIVDDYGYVKGCKQASDEYRATHGIADPIVDIDGMGAYWIKT